MSPLFMMINKEYILSLIDEHLEGTDQFLVDMTIGTDNKISVYLDGDTGVTIDDCVALSRAIEHNLDREEEDFALSVSSAGIDQPFISLRQYVKNIGRPVKVLLNDGSIKKGILQQANKSEITIAEPKKNKNKKSKKMVAGEPIQILMADITQTKAIIIF